MNNRTIIYSILTLLINVNSISSQTEEKVYSHLVSMDLPWPGYFTIDYQYNFNPEYKKRLHAIGITVNTTYDIGRFPLSPKTEFFFDPKSNFKTNLYSFNLFYHLYWKTKYKKIIPSFKVALNYIFLDPKNSNISNFSAFRIDNLIRANYLLYKRISISIGFGLSKYLKKYQFQFEGVDFTYPKTDFRVFNKSFLNSWDFIAEGRLGYSFY